MGFKKNILMMLLILIFSISNAQTITQASDEEICSNLKDCNEVYKKLEKKAFQLLRELPIDLTKFMAVWGHTPLTLDHEGARAVCQRFRGRLPTARELVQIAMSLGAKGFSDPLQGLAVFVSGSEEFYYDNKGYISPPHAISRYRLWSSDYTSKDKEHVVTLDLNTGYTMTSAVDDEHQNIALCLPLESTSHESTE